MPRPALPPTPAASTDITGKPADPGLAHDPSWTLPPAALAAERSNSRGSVSSSSVASCNASDSSYHPTSPVTHTSPTSSRKRPAAANGAASAKDDDYNLPPPPTRLRKIIQMKPKGPEDEDERASATQDAAALSTSPGTSKAKGNNTSSAGGNGRGKKNGNGSTAAGRKIARKTAHSLIERRRRSKMNEEFGTLKDMIPACAGQEMHKLAILQASIEYMRYLEHCVAELKTNRSKQNVPDAGALQSESNYPTPNPSKPTQEDFDDAPSEDEDDQDEKMSDISPSHTPNAPFTQPMHAAPGSHSTTTSPSIDPVDSGDRPTFSATTSPAIWPTPSNASISGSSRRPSSIITSPAMYGAQGAHQNYVFSTTGSHSNTASPSILPSPGAMGMSAERNHSFSLTSPALGPQPDSREDHEATAALLMLNSDRRRWDGRGVDAAARGAVQEARAPVRGKMSVRDLLSG